MVEGVVVAPPPPAAHRRRRPWWVAVVWRQVVHRVVGWGPAEESEEASEIRVAAISCFHGRDEEFSS